MKYGAIGAVAWQASPNLLIGPGVGVFSTFEGSKDDFSLFPFLVLEWNFRDDWTLSTGSGSIASHGPNLRLAYQANDALEFGMEAGYETFEFRLNDDHQVSGGIGKESHVPVAFTATYAPTESLTISGSIGASLMGNLQFNDRNGNEVYNKDYDIAPIFGLKASLKF